MNHEYTTVWLGCEVFSREYGIEDKFIKQGKLWTHMKFSLIFFKLLFNCKDLIEVSQY